jgi:hypothetical protein
MNKAATGTMVKVEPPKTFGYQKYKTHHGEPKDDKPTEWIKKKEKRTEWIKKKEKPTEWIKKKEKPTEWIKKKEIVGDQTKGGSYKPGWKPQLSVRTAKKGTFSSIDTDRLLAQMKVRHSGGMPPATKYKKYLKSLRKATSSKFPANAFTAGKTALGAAQLKAHLKTKDASTFLKRRMILGAGKPSAAMTTFIKRRRQLGSAGSVAKKLLKRTGLGKAVLAATAVAGAYEAGKRNLLKMKKKKVQKKATGGEIIIGRGVDIDLL